MAHSPLAQFEIKPIHELPPFFGYDISFTNSSLFMVLAIMGAWMFFALAMRRQALIPGRWQSMAEGTYGFVQGVVRENAGEAGMRYFPFIFTLFLFILFMNLLGMVPYSFTPTSHIITTFGMSFVVFAGITLVAIIKQGPIGFLKHFIPSGMPIALIPMILLIELVSYIARPFSLAIRLAANMIAGHILLKVIAGFVFPLGIFGIAPLVFSTLITGLEVFVALLQAYVFALLSSIYLGEALADEHH